MVIRLAFTPCLVETVVIGISSRILFKYALGYEFPWLWGFLLGFILAAVSPACTVAFGSQANATKRRSFAVKSPQPTAR